jgi:hypothetical protein
VCECEGGSEFWSKSLGSKNRHSALQFRPPSHSFNPSLHFSPTYLSAMTTRSKAAKTAKQVAIKVEDVIVGMKNNAFSLPVLDKVKDIPTVNDLLEKWIDKEKGLTEVSFKQIVMRGMFTHVDHTHVTLTYCSSQHTHTIVAHTFHSEQHRSVTTGSLANTHATIERYGGPNPNLSQLIVR